MQAAQTVEVRHQLLERVMEARVQVDRLFGLVKPEALYDRPIPERHRIIFYIGHLEAFDWNLLRERVLGLEAFHPEFDRLFSFGIDPVDKGWPSDQPKDWPSLREVRGYVVRVRETLDASLAGRAFSDHSGREEFSANLLMNVAIEHRLMHAETLAYMLHQLPLDKKVREAPVPGLAVRAVTPRMVEIPAGTATLGLSRSDGTFGWDNEYEADAVDVPAFAIDQHKVTNREYLEFINAGGYENRALWTDEDWKWRTDHNISRPAFWNRIEGSWQYRTMFDDVPLPLDWPVYVSHAEASAHARWAGKSLPTEAQWHRAAYATPENSERPYPWGSDEPSRSRGNFNFYQWDPAAVGASSEGRSAFGVADLAGNGWEWTSTVFEPFPGFKPFPFYPGYSADFFDGKHFVMKGGSSRTAACMLRRSFRNWFQPHYQYVYAGFRCVSN